MTGQAYLRSIHVALLAGALALSTVADVHGQSTPTPSGGGLGDGSGSAISAGVEVPTSYVTNSIVKNINAARAECGSYDPVYRIDCLRQRFADIARRIPSGPAYSQARQIIGRAASQLGRIQAGISDAKAPRKRSRGNARLREAKVYIAARRDKLNKALEQARQVVAEAETQLLRAGENSEKRAGHYQQIAAALGSTKVLLRSA